MSADLRSCCASGHERGGPIRSECTNSATTDQSNRLALDGVPSCTRVQRGRAAAHTHCPTPCHLVRRLWLQGSAVASVLEQAYPNTKAPTAAHPSSECNPPKGASRPLHCVVRSGRVEGGRGGLIHTVLLRRGASCFALLKCHCSTESESDDAVERQLKR